MKATSIIVLLCVCLFLGCKKNDTGGNATNIPQLTFTPAALPVVSGMVQVSSEMILLHVKGKAQISAKVYNGDGTLAAPQPSLSYAATQSSIITVNNAGLITAIQMGDAQVKVSDGVHSDGYVNVSVISDTTTIPAGPANISFNSLNLAVNINSQAAIPAYTITDYSGNTIAASPVFEFTDSLSSSAVNGNSIKAGNSTGVSHLTAKVNGIYLNGSLPVAVTNNTTGDTTVSISILSDYPSVFKYYNTPALPCRISVWETWYKNNTWFENVFTTSPDKMVVDYPDVIGSNGNGVLISKAPGKTPVTLYYKTGFTKSLSTVDVDMTGSWGCTLNNTTYSFCFEKDGSSGIRYGVFYGLSPIYNGINDGGSLIGGTQLLYGSKPDTNVNGSYLEGVLKTYINNGAYQPETNQGDYIGSVWMTYNGIIPVPGIGYNNYDGTTTGVPGFVLYWIGDIGKLKTYINEQVVYLVNGAGSCTPPTDTLSLDTALVGGANLSSTWTTNGCFADNYGGINKVVLYQNHKFVQTFASPDAVAYLLRPISWSTNHKDSIFFTSLDTTTNTYYNDTFKVASFVDSTVKLESMGNCTPLWTKQ